MAYSHISTSKLTNSELHSLGPDELIRRLRKSDQERSTAIKDHAQLMKDFNQRMQVHLLEIRSLKEVNQRLQDDNQELRGLCCFLDDERQKGRKLANEWQRFGRYTSGVMRSEVSTYQQKLQQLETRQEELLGENEELKHLCMYLGQDGGYFSSDSRDQGDGDSNSSSTTDKPFTPENGPMSPLRENPTSTDIHRRLENEQTLQYVRQLEERVQRLEEEKKQISERARPDHRTPSPTRHGQRRFFRTPDTAVTTTTNHPSADLASGYEDRNLSRESQHSSPSKNSKAVSDAMKVLEIHEQLECPRQSITEEENLTSAQKSVLRQMCGVVWRKLGDEVPGYKTQV